jgi:hypothetical protein
MVNGRRMFAITLVLALTAALGISLGSAGAASERGAEAIDGDYLGVSPAARDLAPSDPAASSGTTVPRSNPDPAATGASAGDGGSDPLLADRRRAHGRTPATNLDFAGVGNPVACGGCLPPDTTGDVGPNHYIQMVNATKVAIFNKSGTPLAAPFDLSTLFTSTSCSTDDAGDPQVLYDPLADRWLLAQFQLDDRLCFAISTTPDPMGTYNRYSFVAPEFPDYFKVGVWPTGYYVSTNESTYTAYAFNRTAMLAGDPATGIRFPGETNFLMPADVDGPNAPDPQGGIFYTFKDDSFHGGGADRLELFRLTPDFATPANSTFTTDATIPVASFTYTVCGFFVLDCVPQPGTAEGLDAVSEWPMQRLVYRRYSGHETLLGNFTIDVGSDRAGIRWFELRNAGGGYALFQEGTHAPADGLHRFMGSIAMDQDGNIALGYSVSSGSVFPGIRYATRAPGDPLGTLQAEAVMQAGAGSQTSTSNRWGDYSAMNIDPADDCSFWYTNEHYTATSTSTWSTRVARFKEPSCPSPRTLTVIGAGTGSGFVDSAPAGIDCGHNTPGAHTDCTESYAGGTAVTLTAHADAGSDVSGLSGAGCSANPCTVTMDAAKSVTATYTSHEFTIGKVKRNTKKGTATIAVDVPGPGELALTGKQVKRQRPARAARRTATKPVSAAGIVKLKIKAKGKAKKKLNKKGKVKVKTKITYTPTGGTPSSQNKKVKLKKKR